jgi:hypothetical protein
MEQEVLTWEEKRVITNSIMPGSSIRKKMDIISSAEESFARSVILSLIVKRPISAWYFLIPGVFILQYLRRSSEIRKYTTNTLFPKILALEAAHDILMGEDRKERLCQVEQKVKEWLTSVKLYSDTLQQKQMKEIEIHIDHYCKLLNAEGKNYYSLIKDAYKSRQHYEEYLHQLSLTEKEVDSAITEILGEGIKEQLLKENEQMEEIRKKEIDKIFPL